MSKSSTTPLWAILGAYNEEDIVFATVSNAFAQGADRVLVVDNGSTDETLLEALKAGAEIAHTFETDSYDEMHRIRIMNDLVHHESETSEHDAIWWLWLDCDELPCGPSGERLSDFLSRLPNEHRAVGAQQINHFPKPWPQYQRRFHPWDFMPYCEEYDTATFPAQHCPHRHWKHPLHKYVRGRPSVRAKSGFHMGLCGEPLTEPAETIELHHFPFRERKYTYDRYLRLCGVENARNAYNDQTSLEQKSAITKRFEMLDNVYGGRWEKVNINPAPGAPTGGEVGVRPSPKAFGAIRWYPEDSVPDASLFEAVKMSVLISGEERAAYPGLILASVLADLGASVQLVCDVPEALDGVRDLTGTTGLILVPPGHSQDSRLTFVATDAPWIATEIADVSKGDGARGAHDTIVLSGIEMPTEIGNTSTHLLDQRSLPAAKHLPVMRDWEEREDLVFLAASLQSPAVIDVLADLVRPQLGGVTLALLNGTADSPEEDIRSLLDAADKVGLRIVDLVDTGPVALAEVMTRAKVLLTPAIEHEQAVSDAVRIGVPVVQFDLGASPSADISDRLADRVIDALRTAPDMRTSMMELAEAADPRVAAGVIGDRLAAILTGSAQPGLSVQSSDEADHRRVVTSAWAQKRAGDVNAEGRVAGAAPLEDRFGALHRDLGQLRDEIGMVHDDVRQLHPANHSDPHQQYVDAQRLKRKLRRLRRQRTLLLVPFMLLTFPISVPVALVALYRKRRRKRKAKAAQAAAELDRPHEGIDRWPDAQTLAALGLAGPLTATATYFADRRWMEVVVTFHGRDTDATPILSFSTGRDVSAFSTARSETAATGQRWIFTGQANGVVDGETVTAELLADAQVRSEPAEIQIANRQAPQIHHSKHHVNESVIGVDDLSRMMPNPLSLRLDPDRSLKPEIAFFPCFESPDDLADHCDRARHYLSDKAGLLHRVSMLTSEAVGPADPPLGSAMASPNAGDGVEHTNNQADFRRRLAQARLVLVWKPISKGALEKLRTLLPGANVRSLKTDDPTAIENEEFFGAPWLVLPSEKRAGILEQSKSRFSRALAQHRSKGVTKSIVFGPGPSIDRSFDYNFDDCQTIVCASLVADRDLMAHIQPDFICANRPNGQLGASVSPKEFSEDLADYITQSGAYLVATAPLGYLLSVRHPEITDQVILIEQLTEDPVVDLETFFALPRLTGILNTHMLPIAATLSDTIFLLGWDGEDPNTKKEGDAGTQDESLVHSEHECVSTLEMQRRVAAQDRFADATERSCVAGEMWGKQYVSLHPSSIPALKARPVTEAQATRQQTERTSLSATVHAPVRTPAGRRRVCIVMRSPHTLFSGGRYHAFMMAEALASLGDDVLVWTDNYPSWLYNLALHPHHHLIQFQVDAFANRPNGEFDIVVVVPDMSCDPVIYTEGLMLARESNAVVAMINFESPNWFNEGAAHPRDETQWKYWQASSAYADVVVSSAETSVTYAQKYYTAAHPACDFPAIPPSINKLAADHVWAQGYQPERQIICISRFGSTARHKNIQSLTSLFSEETRGYTFALVVGTAELPDEDALAKVRSEFAAYDVKLRLLHGISDIEKFEQIARSRCMVFPSLFEGFGYPPIEALYIGRPCITYDLPVLREFSDGLTTFVPKGDLLGMRGALASLLSGPQADPDALRNGVAALASTTTFATRLDTVFRKRLTQETRAVSSFQTDAFLSRSAAAAKAA